MDLPKPTAAHRRLQALAGRWRGDEVSSVGPERLASVGHFENRIDVDGLFLINDYRQERDGEVVFRGHGVYGWDAGAEHYTMYWFDSGGTQPRPIPGRWHADTLTFAAEGAPVRFVYTLLGEGRFRFRIERQDGDGSPLLAGDYQRL